MQIEQSEYQQSLIEHYYQLCGKQLNEMVSLQAQVNLLIKKIEDKDKEIADLVVEIDKVIVCSEKLNVNENTGT